MENQEHHQSLESLKAELAEVAKQITDADAAGKTGPELDALHKRHQELTQAIEEAPISEDLDQAA